MTYFVQGMPQKLSLANGTYEEMMRRQRGRPTPLIAQFGVALEQAKQYFEADQKKGGLFQKLSMHLGRCEECRTAGWEKCDAMTGWLRDGKELP